MDGPANPVQDHEASVDDVAVDKAIRYLTPDLKEFLADLDGAAMSLATAAIQLLPFGSRLVLLETEMATTDCPDDDSCAVGLRLTPLGFAVIARVAGGGDDDDELRRLAEVAAAIVDAHAAQRDRDRSHQRIPSVSAQPPAQPSLPKVSQKRSR